MNDARDLARRYLALWDDYLTALLADPGAMEPLWGQLAGAPAMAAAQPDDPTSPSGPAARAETSPGASGECRRLLAELAQRLAVVEQRLAVVEEHLAAIERGPIERGGGAAARPRRRNRRVRA